MNQSFVIGFHGAAKESTCAVCDRDGIIQALSYGGPLAFHINADLKGGIHTGLRSVAIQCSLPSETELVKRASAIVICMSGAFLPVHEDILRNILLDMGAPANELLIAKEDVWGSMAANSLETGILASVSTGSNVFVKGESKQFAVGGWGSDLSDAGSGFFIGMQALRALLQGFEGSRPVTARFTEALLAALQVSDPRYLTTWYSQLRVSNRWRQVIADLSIVVSTLYDTAKDRTADTILREAEDAFALSLSTALNRSISENVLALEEPVTVLIEGGVALNCSHYFNFLLEHLDTPKGCKLPNLRQPVPTAIKLGQIRCIVGCLAMALRAANMLKLEATELQFLQIQINNIVAPEYERIA